MLLPYLSFRGLLTNHCLICIQIPPPFKLTAFYLLDAISKNLYEPYARHFGPVVVPLFLDTYSQVDDSTKAKMIEMLATWRAGAPNGRELFGAVPQLAIEQEVFGTGASSVCSFSDRLASLLVTLGIQDTTRVSAAQVLGELQFAIGQADREMQSNPYNNTVRNQLPVLHQVRFTFCRFRVNRQLTLFFSFANLWRRDYLRMNYAKYWVSLETSPDLLFNRPLSHIPSSPTCQLCRLLLHTHSIATIMLALPLLRLNHVHPNLDTLKALMM